DWLGAGCSRAPGSPSPQRPCRSGRRSCAPPGWASPSRMPRASGRRRAGQVGRGPARPAAYPQRMALEPLSDGHGRTIADLRLSVTDRCNYRCQYCMPAEGLPWLERDAVLRFEEIERIVALLAQMGIASLRLTGGEPLVRRDFPRLAAMLAPLVDDLSVTTNGYLLE